MAHNPAEANRFAYTIGRNHYTLMSIQTEFERNAPASLSPLYDATPPHLSRWRRAQIPLIAGIVYSILRTFGPTLRFEILGWHHVERAHEKNQRCILAFWHRVILPAVYWARHRNIVVMNTTHFDGQWTRKVIEWFGYTTAQGSSTRGGLRALAVMARRLEGGVDAAFTIDGPRGPRYVAKPGPVMLARRTGCPVVAFHIGVDRGRTFTKTWDHFLLPYPFARTLVLVGRPMYVPRDASRELLEAKHVEMQSQLERLRNIAEAWYTISEADRNRYRAEFSA